jgi:hypothetical protein
MLDILVQLVTWLVVAFGVLGLLCGVALGVSDA